MNHGRRPASADKSQLRLAELNHDTLIEILNSACEQSSPSTRLPPLNGSGTRRLLQTINRLRFLDTSWQTEFKNEASDITAIQAAIDTLAHLLPIYRHIYTADVKMAVLCNASGDLDEGDTTVENCECRLSTLDELIGVIQDAQRVGIPMLPMGHLSPDFSKGRAENQRWRGVVPRLESSFHSCLRGRSKAVGYRFIEKVLPHITGETPSLENIKQLLKETARLARSANSICQ